MRWPIKSYKDIAHAFLGKNSKENVIIKIELNPIIEFDNDFVVSKKRWIKCKIDHTDIALL